MARLPPLARSWRWPLALVLVLLATAAGVRLLSASNSSTDDGPALIEDDEASFDPIDLPEPLAGSVDKLDPSSVPRNPKDFRPPSLGGGRGPKREFSVRVVDRDGIGLPGATVGVWTRNASHPYAKALLASREAYFARYYPGAPADSDSVTWSWMTWPDPTWRDPAELRKTDEDGRCSLALPDGKLVIAAAHATAGTSGRWMAEPWEALAGPEGTEPFELLLQVRPSCRVTGRVVGPDGQAVDGAVVFASSPAGRSTRCAPRMPRPAESDDTGRFALELDGLGYATLCALVRGQWSNQRLVSLSPETTTDITLRIGSAASVSGRVLDAKGEPVVGAQVRASGPDRQHEQTSSGEDGTYSLGLPQAGRWLVGAAKDAWLPQDAVALDIQPSAPAAQATLQLIEGASIRGRVRWKSGEPAAGVRITSWMDFSSRMNASDVLGLMLPFQSCTSDAEGQFELTPLHPARRYDVRAGQSQFSFAEPAAKDVAPGAVLELEVDASTPDAGALDGRVVDDETGEPIQEFSVCIQHNRDSEGRFSTSQEFRPFRDPDGNFHVDGIRWPSPYVRVLAARYAERVVGPVTLAAQASPLEIRLGRPAQLDVRVVDEQGRGRAGAAVLLGLKDSGDRHDTPVAREMTTDAEGHAIWVGLAPETYSVQAISGDRRTSMGTVTLLSQGRHERVLTLDDDAEAGRLIVRVLDLEGAAVPDALVKLTSFGSERAEMLPRRLKTNEDGEGVFAGLPPGRCSVLAEIGGRYAIELATVGAGSSATVELQPDP